MFYLRIDRPLRPVHLEFIPTAPWRRGRTDFVPLSWEVHFRVLSETGEELADLCVLSEMNKLTLSATGPDVGKNGLPQRVWDEKRLYDRMEQLLRNLGYCCGDPWFSPPLPLCCTGCSGIHECFIAMKEKECIIIRSGRGSMEDRLKRYEPFTIREGLDEYDRAYFDRAVPEQIFNRHIDLWIDRPPAQVLAIRRFLAKKVCEAYPYRPGKDPRSIALLEEIKARGINFSNWLSCLEDLTDEEVTCMLDHCRFPLSIWIEKSRNSPLRYSDRSIAERIRDGADKYSWSHYLPD